MTESRRRLLLTGAALGLTPVLSACDPTTVFGNKAADNNTAGNNTTGPGNTTAPGNTTVPDNTTGPSNTTTGGGTLPAGPRVRYDVSSAQGQAMLAVYAKAVGLMTALPEGDPRSWTFQWYSHWVKGAQDQSGKTAELARIYGSASSAARTLAQKMWDGCQAHGDDEDESFFLPWHRMYVMAFENIVRAVAGEPNFTLPYWNYLDPSQRAIPAQFRKPGDPVWGPLYRSSRNAAVNAGGAIASASDLSPGVLSENTYAPFGADQGFCANLDLGLHGTVHVGVGNSTDGMGLVPWAANDPIFWLHHCNIDRLWASWNAAGGSNPSDADFTSKPFPFADASGTQTVYTVGQVLSLQSAGYGYDALVGESGAAIPQAAALNTPPAPFRLPFFDTPAYAQTSTGAGPRAVARRPIPQLRFMPSITHVSEGVRLGSGALRVQLTSTQATPEVAARTLAPLIAPPLRMQKKGSPTPQFELQSTTSKIMAFLQPKKAAAPAKVGAAAPAPGPALPPPSVPAPHPGQKVFLVLSNLSTDVQPGVLYQIYLEAPSTGRGGAPQAYPVGSLNFFSAMSAMGGMKMGGSRARSFDITDLATQLAAQGRLEASPTVSFVPLGKPVSQAQPLIGSISLAIQ
jgi:hypothetical protein